MTSPQTQLQLQSLITTSGKLELSLVKIAIPALDANQVLVRIEATPLNPSDLGLLFGAADLSTAVVSVHDGLPRLTADVPAAAMPSMAARAGTPMPVGNEGAGTVVDGGAAPGARALIGKKVAILGGAMYSQYRIIKADECLVLPDDASAAEGASCYVNPMTALGMVETMRSEGHTALVHTAATSNLGIMLNKICQKDGVALVNIVRKPEQVAQLKAIGAVYVCDSSSSSFMDELTEALSASGATIAFDALGGGPLAGQILSCMERAIAKKATSYSRYGSTVLKQVYLYGGLDTRPTEFRRDFGMAWSMGGWLLFNFFQKLGAEGIAKVKARVAAELKTTFASSYVGELSLQAVLDPANIALYNARATGKKYLINPNKAA